MDLNPTGYEYCAWLASAGLPSVRLRYLLGIYHDPYECYQAFMHQEQAFMETIPARFREVLMLNANPETIAKTRMIMNRKSICAFHFFDDIYPESLKKINDPPAILFYQGKVSCLKKRIIAVVGSRAASYSGQSATRKLSHDLSSHGITVISGLASGIDAIAHSGCIEGGSPTIAVTGCGLDIVYPSANIKLRDTIIQKGGLILSEYPPGEKPVGWHFPIRNRIITGIAKALVLMEAKIRSGSMTSVQHALDQGKDVFVYPGDPSSAYFEGNHQLLREGGIYFTSADDIMEDLHWLDNPPTVRQNSDCSANSAQMTPEAQAVVNALKPGTLGFEKLSAISGLEPSKLLSTLTILQLNGIIEAIPGKQYQLKR